MKHFAHTHRNIAALSAGAILCLSLAACGGGGGGTAAASTQTQVSNGTLATPQYAPGSPELAAFNQLNSMRQQCGFPALSENTLLDKAAANHLTYMQDNDYFAHAEVAGNPGFTGANQQIRAAAVGYADIGGNVDETIYPSSSNIGGALSVTGLASMPYHEAALFAPTTDFGMDYGTVSTYYVAEILNGYQSLVPALANAPLTYPCAGTTGVDFESAGSGENPTPTINGTAVSFPIGTPITVIGNTGDLITLSSGQLADPNGNLIAMDLLDSTNDSTHDLAANAAEAFPTSPLQPNTTYVATLVGADNGNTFTRQFSFTTGSQGQF